MKDFSEVQRYYVNEEGQIGRSEGGWYVEYPDYSELNEAYEEQARENAALKKLLERAHERLDELKQPTYTGTGSDYLDCVLGVGGFEQYGPISGIEKLVVKTLDDNVVVCKNEARFILKGDGK